MTNNITCVYSSHHISQKIQVNENTECIPTSQLFPSAGYLFLVYALQTQNIYIIITHMALGMQYAPLI